MDLTGESPVHRRSRHTGRWPRLSFFAGQMCARLAAARRTLTQPLTLYPVIAVIRARSSSIPGRAGSSTPTGLSSRSPSRLNAARSSGIRFLSTRLRSFREVRRFVSVDSEFYPQLYAYFERRIEDWFAANVPDDIDED